MFQKLLTNKTMWDMLRLLIVTNTNSTLNYSSIWERHQVHRLTTNEHFTNSHSCLQGGSCL
jgi:hypothetical protein